MGGGALRTFPDLKFQILNDVQKAQLLTHLNEEIQITHVTDASSSVDVHAIELDAKSPATETVRYMGDKWNVKDPA